MSILCEDSSFAVVLREVWGFTAFRPHQLDICKAILAKRDVVVIMATGAGKSLLYQLPVVVAGKKSQSVALVVSPLISLMEDQVSSLTALGVKAQIISSDFDFSCISRSSAVLYITPESLQSRIEVLASSLAPLLTCIAVDEAHCMVEWGFDFRPAYSSLANIRHHFPATPIIALTATATPSAASSITSLLQLRQPLVVRTTFNRPNLFYSVQRNADVSVIANILRNVYPTRNNRLSTLIYVLTQADATNLSVHLQGVLPVSVASYHAGMSPQQRSAVHRNFSNDDIQIIVATIAFGMGINKPDIRYVIHYGLPSSLEAYYQQTGRAGRDGAAAKCILLHNRKDVSRHYNIKNHYSSMNAAEVQRIADMSYYANSNKCRRKMLLCYFDGGDIRSDAESARGATQSSCCCDVCDLELKHEQLAASDHANNGDWVLKGGIQLPTAINATSEIRLLLRAVIDCGEKTGASLPVQLLLGSSGQQLQKMKWLMQKTTYGQGKHHTQKYWVALFHQLVEIELLLEGVSMRNQAGFSYQCYRLTDKGRNVLQRGGREEYTLMPSAELRAALPIARARVTKQQFDSPASPTPASTPLASKTPDSVSSEVIEEIVRNTRSSLAKKLDMPPYSILSTADIDVLVAARPTSTEQLHSLQGWGLAKVKLFGSAFVGAIRECLNRANSNSANPVASSDQLHCTPLSDIKVPISDNSSFQTEESETMTIIKNEITTSDKECFLVTAPFRKPHPNYTNNAKSYCTSTQETSSCPDDDAWNALFDKCDSGCNTGSAVSYNAKSATSLLCDDTTDSTIHLATTATAPSPPLRSSVLTPAASPSSVTTTTPNPLTRCATINKVTGSKRSRPSIPGLGVSNRPQQFCGPRIKRVQTVPAALPAKDETHLLLTKSTTAPASIPSVPVEVSQETVLAFLRSHDGGCTFLQLVQGVEGTTDAEVTSRSGSSVRSILRKLGECCAVYMDGDKYCVL